MVSSELTSRIGRVIFQELFKLFNELQIFFEHVFVELMQSLDQNGLDPYDQVVDRHMDGQYRGQRLVVEDDDLEEFEKTQSGPISFERSPWRQVSAYVASKKDEQELDT